MDVPALIAACRRSAGLTQSELAQRAGTSQAAVSSYERGGREPSVGTLCRLLRVAGHDLAVEPIATPVRTLTRADAEQRGRKLEQVIELAAALPTRHGRELRFPALASRA